MRRFAWLVLLLAGTVRAAEPALDPWQWIAEARTRLAAEGALATDFEQVFVPAGFATGESERGQLALAVPDCLRWDYEEPFPKSFLLCGEIAYQWIPGEPSGRRARIAPRDQAGLDLFLLPAAELGRRYRARAEQTPEGHLIVLEPLAESGGIRSARLLLDSRTFRPRALAWVDSEGNRSRFEFAEFRPLADRGAFAPPLDVEWRDE